MTMARKEKRAMVKVTRKATRTREWKSYFKKSQWTSYKCNKAKTAGVFPSPFEIFLFYFNRFHLYISFQTTHPCFPIPFLILLL